MRRIIFLFLLLGSIKAAASPLMTCMVHGVKDHPEMENAYLQSDMETYDTYLHLADGKTVIPLITPQRVSTFQSPRSSCKFVLEELRHSATNEIYEIAFKFSTCTAQSLGTIFAQVRFSFDTKKGAYVETLLQLIPKSLGIPLSDCSLKG